MPKAQLHLVLFLSNEEFDFLLLFLIVQVLEPFKAELILSALKRLQVEIRVISEFVNELSESQEGSTFPLGAIAEKNWHVLIVHIVGVIRTDSVNDPGLFFRMDVDVVVGIVNADLLVPKNDCEHPVAAVPARLLVKLLIEAPLCATLLDMLVAEDPRDCQILLVTAQHIELLAIDYFTFLPQQDDFVGLFSEPSLEVCRLVVSNFDLVGCHVHSLFLRKWDSEVVSVTSDVNDYALISLLDGQTILEVFLDSRRDPWILS